MINTLANMAMQRSQDQNQAENFQRQMAANDYGKDAIGNTVNRQQRQDWNSRLTDFRGQVGAGATSQNLFDSLNGTPYQLDRVAIQGPNGNAVFADGDNMALGNPAGNPRGTYDSLSKGYDSFADRVGAGYDGFRNGKNQSIGRRMGNAYAGLTGAPQSFGTDINDGWSDANDNGGNEGFGGGGYGADEDQGGWGDPEGNNSGW